MGIWAGRRGGWGWAREGKGGEVGKGGDRVEGGWWVADG